MSIDDLANKTYTRRDAIPKILAVPFALMEGLSDEPEHVAKYRVSVPNPITRWPKVKTTGYLNVEEEYGCHIISVQADPLTIFGFVVNSDPSNYITQSKVRADRNYGLTPEGMEVIDQKTGNSRSSLIIKGKHSMYGCKYEKKTEDEYGTEVQKTIREKVEKPVPTGTYDPLTAIFLLMSSYKEGEDISLPVLGLRGIPGKSQLITFPTRIHRKIYGDYISIEYDHPEDDMQFWALHSYPKVRLSKNHENIDGLKIYLPEEVVIDEVKADVGKFYRNIKIRLE